MIKAHSKLKELQMIELRKMSTNDLDICIGIYKRAFGHSENSHDNKKLTEYFGKYINNHDKYALCIETQSEIVGFILAFQIPDTLVEYGVFIDNIAIDPIKQRNGYAFEALKKFCKTLPSWTYINLMTIKDSPGYKLYKKAGYIESKYACIMDYTNQEYNEKVKDNLKNFAPSINTIESMIDDLLKENEKHKQEIEGLQSK